MEVIVMNTETNITPINEDFNIVKYEANNIKNLIYYIRGKQVILDRDLAELYNCKNGHEIKNISLYQNQNQSPLNREKLFLLRECLLFTMAYRIYLI